MQRTEGATAILVTGGCGFIGANLVSRLAQRRGYRVRVLDNESTGRQAAIAGLGAEFVAGDVRDGSILRRALAGVDVVVHLAAHTRVVESIDDPRLNFDVNVNGTLELLEAMRAVGTRRLINASTGGAILGEMEPPVHEGMVPRPIAPYGASKLAAEGYCAAYGASYGMRTVSLRFSNVYGPRSLHKGSAVATFFRHVLAGETVTVHGDGSQVRDFVFVEDLCDGILAAIEREADGVIQLGSGRPVTIDALLEEVGRVVAPLPLRRRYEPFRAGELRATYCDITLARTRLGFEPRTALAQGLASTWRWFATQRS